MNKSNEIPYSFKMRTNHFASRPVIMDNTYNRRIFGNVKPGITVSMSQLVIAILVAIVFAVALTLMLAAGALYFIA